MKADYKNWMPKGMVASFIGGTAGALAVVPAARLLMPEGPAKSVVTAVSAAAGCAFGGASIWSYLMYRAFDYNGTRQMSRQIIEGIAEYVNLPEGGTCLDQKRLETIQDQMHDFVEHQMKDHPEIFEDETLKPKEKGRNSDFSKEFYLRLKQQEYERLENKCQEKETQIEALDDTAKEMKQDIESNVDQYVDSVVNSEMKKEFMRYATLENPKTTLGKIVSKAFKTFKEWWDKTKKPEIAEKAKTSILQKLRESQAIVDQRKEQQSPNLNRNNLRPER